MSYGTEDVGDIDMEEPSPDQESAPNAIFWTCEESAERLTADTVAEAVEEFSESMYPRPLPETVTVFGYARKVISEREAERAVSYALEGIIESLDEEYGDPEEATELPDEIRAAAKALGMAILAHYPVWQCDLVTTEEVRVAEYIDAEDQP